MNPRLPVLLLVLTAFACKKDPKDPKGTTTSSTPTTSTDEVAPVLVSMTPADGAEDVDPSVAITATFSEALDPATVGENALQVTADGEGVPGSVVLDGVELTFTPAADLPASAVVQVMLDSALTDLAGNRLGNAGATTFQVSWAPSGPFLLFAGSSMDGGQTELWRFDLDGSGPVAAPLNADANWASDYERLSVSPDGRRVLVIEGGSYEVERRLLLGSAGGGGFRWLTEGTARAGDSAWSPDGSRLAYVYGESTVDVKLMVLGVGEAAPMSLELGPARFAGWVGWSPDGSQVAWIGDDGHLWLAPSDGSGSPEDLSGVPALGIGYGVGLRVPRWAPDGSAIAFGEDPEERCFAELQACQQSRPPQECNAELWQCLRSGPLYTVAPGSAPVQVTPAGATFYEFDWADTDRLVWRGCDQCVTETLYVSDTGTGAATSLTPVGLAGGAWWLSPDGSQVAYQEARGSSELHVVDVDTGPSSARMVSPAGWFVRWPVWAPDSSSLVFTASSGEVYVDRDVIRVLVAASDGSSSVEVDSLQSYGNDFMGPATFTADGGHVLYQRWQATAQPESYVVLAPTDGSVGTPLDVGTFLPSALQSWDPAGPGAPLDL